MSGPFTNGRDRVVPNEPAQSAATTKLATLEMLASVHGAPPDAIASRRAELEQQIAMEAAKVEAEKAAAAAKEEPAGPSFDERLAELAKAQADTARTLDAFAAGVAAGRKGR